MYKSDSKLNEIFMIPYQLFGDQFFSVHLMGCRLQQQQQLQKQQTIVNHFHLRVWPNCWDPTETFERSIWKRHH